MFKDKDSIRSVMESNKIRKSQGFNLKQKRIIKEGLEHLLELFTQLLKKIYTQSTIQNQWFWAKTIPIHKKDPKTKLHTIDLSLTSAKYVRCSKNNTKAYFKDP
jgi:hypothetical protein